MTSALAARDVIKSYDSVKALDSVSLSVNIGEIFGLVGPNGAGKTTLVRALTGTTSVEGAISVFDSPPDEIDSERIGVLPQSFRPPSRLTPTELINYYGGLYEQSRQPASLLAEVGLDTEAADQQYETLSGGQKRRVCVAIALVNNPEILFLDEPTTGIDPAGRRSLWSLFEELATSGTTLFLTSHSMDEVERLADRVGFLSEGKLVTVGPPSSLIDTHGGDSRLIIDTSETPERCGLTEVDYRVKPQSNQLIIEGVSPQDISDIIMTLNSAGASFESLVWKQPSLEDAYLALTGKRFEGVSDQHDQESVNQ
jgi:ABC-2 type transport system ATP-binding protein